MWAADPEACCDLGRQGVTAVAIDWIKELFSPVAVACAGGVGRAVRAGGVAWAVQAVVCDGRAASGVYRGSEGGGCGVLC